MKLTQKYLYFILLVCYLISCQKTDEPGDDHINNPPITVTDELSVAQDSILSISGIPNPTLESLLAPDHRISMRAWLDLFMPNWDDTVSTLRVTATSPQQQLNVLTGKLLTAAFALSEKKSTLTPANSASKPEQWGIAYSRGSSNYRQRLLPTDGNSLHKSQEVFGLDCGGFIETLFKIAGVETLRDFSSNQFPAALNAALPESPYKNLELVDKDRLDPSDMQSGDIVIWNNHIGIIGFHFPLTEPFVYQSNGTGWPSDKADNNGTIIRTAIQDQKNNQGKNRGVHPVSWSTARSADYWPGGYKIWRLQKKTCTEEFTSQQIIELCGTDPSGISSKYWGLAFINGVEQNASCLNPANPHYPAYWFTSQGGNRKYIAMVADFPAGCTYTIPAFQGSLQFCDGDLMLYYNSPFSGPWNGQHAVLISLSSSAFKFLSWDGKTYEFIAL